MTLVMFSVFVIFLLIEIPGNLFSLPVYITNTISSLYILAYTIKYLHWQYEDYKFFII